MREWALAVVILASSWVILLASQIVFGFAVFGAIRLCSKLWLAWGAVIKNLWPKRGSCSELALMICAALWLLHLSPILALLLLPHYPLLAILVYLPTVAFFIYSH